MTLEQLRIFVAVAELEHVTRAARRLNLSQSATSAAVAALEQNHATILFHRIGRSVRLTEAGRVFLVEAKAVLARAAAAEAMLDDLAGLRHGTLTVYASQTIASYWLPPHLVRFRRAYPGIDIRLSVGNTAQVARAVEDGTAELGLVEGAVDEERFDLTVVGHDRLVLIAGAGHPWGDGRHIALEDLASTDWVLREVGSGTRSEFEFVLRKAGIDPAQLKVAMELPSNEAVRAAVAAGGGVTAISELVAEGGIQAGELRAVPLEATERAFFAVRHRESYRSKAADALLRAIAEAEEGAAHAPSPALPGGRR
ncbi:LysR family transcriptional regulator [Lutibaculum baratangense]|uniref:LysR family transcriptional regulator YeiE n=1 Tax=Lutibaculum baratangense AMV1 TaxID=631454 RepID=V4R5D8_9HYPH|nr:LysR family transcriptional regulator [Lutibaculum baratangense]ESR27167.1 LysR family transcriptional regulator YeiE [Lutibaculum baratangense AMV1]